MAAIDNGIYDRIADTWWEEDGFMALLRTAVNPARFAYFEDVLTRRLRLEAAALDVLDVGCGGGLLAERFAGLGCRVTGVDPSAPSLSAARRHAALSGHAIRYLQGTGERLPFADAAFDLVYCCDVLEHVDDMSVVVAEIGRVLRPGGWFFFDTINRTLLSRLLAIKLAQDWAPTRFIPPDVHVWDKFITPDELGAALSANGMQAREFTGLAPVGSPLEALGAFVRHKLGRLDFAGLGAALTLGPSRSRAVSYMGYARRQGARESAA